MRRPEFHENVLKLRLNALSLVFIGYGVWEFFIFDARCIDFLAEKSLFSPSLDLCSSGFLVGPNRKERENKSKKSRKWERRKQLHPMANRKGAKLPRRQAGGVEGERGLWGLMGAGSEESGQLRYRPISFRSNNASPTDIQINGILTRLKSRLVNATEKSSRMNFSDNASCLNKKQCWEAKTHADLSIGKVDYTDNVDETKKLN